MNNNNDILIVKKNRNKKLGVSMSFLVLLLVSLEGIIIPLFTLVFTATFTNKISFSFSYSIIKEVVIIMIMLLISPVVMINSFKRIKNKSGILVFMSGAIGTMIGNLLFVIAINLAGSGYGSTLTAFYPIFMLGLSFLILKEKTNWKVMIGIFITIISGFIFVLVPTIIESNKITGKVIIGMMLGLFAGFFWAVESLFVKLGMSVSEKEDKVTLTNREVISIRSFGVLFSTIIVTLPLSFIFGNTFDYIGKIFSNWIAMLMIVGLASSVFLLRFVHIISIYHAGVRLTSTIDTNSFIISAIFVFILTSFNGDPGNIYGVATKWWTLMLILPVMFGIFIVVYFSPIEKNDEVLKIIERTD